LGQGGDDQLGEPKGGEVDQQVVEAVIGKLADVGGELVGTGTHAASPPPGAAWTSVNALPVLGETSEANAHLGM
jgi:hypothetical protein